MLNYLTFFLLWLNRWSVDVALGVVMGSYGISNYLDTSFSITTFLAEFSAVLCIYNLDHWIDTKKDISITLSKRRSYYLKNQFWLMVIVIISCLIGIISSFYLDKTVFFNGLILTFLMVIYFIFNFYFQKKYFLKEFFIALFYTLGIHLPLIQFIENLFFISLLPYFFVSFSNLIIFSSFEEKENSIKNSTLFDTFFKVNLLCHLTIIIITLYFNHTVENIMIQFLFILAHFVYYIFLKNENYFIQHERFRYIGDTIFILLGFILSKI